MWLWLILIADACLLQNQLWILILQTGRIDCIIWLHVFCCVCRTFGGGVHAAGLLLQWGGQGRQRKQKKHVSKTWKLTPTVFSTWFCLVNKGSRTRSTQVPNTSFEPLKDSLAGVHLASESIVGTTGTPSTSINLAFEIPHFQHNSVYTFGIASRNPHAPHRTPRTPSAPVPNCKLEP